MAQIFKRPFGGGVILNLDDAAERRTVEQCFRTNKTMLNPIVDWSEENVWEFLNEIAHVPHCELYDQGYKRLGCIGCPMSNNREAELERYPKYRDNYLRAFGRMLQERDRRGMGADARYFTTPQGVMDWYLEKNAPVAGIEGQVSIDDLEVVD